MARAAVEEAHRLYVGHAEPAQTLLREAVRSLEVNEFGANIALLLRQEKFADPPNGVITQGGRSVLSTLRAVRAGL